jgi:hypothetical protein
MERDVPAPKDRDQDANMVAVETAMDCLKKLRRVSD